MLLAFSSKDSSFKNPQEPESSEGRQRVGTVGPGAIVQPTGPICLCNRTPTATNVDGRVQLGILTSLLYTIPGGSFWSVRTSRSPDHLILKTPRSTDLESQIDVAKSNPPVSSELLQKFSVQLAILSKDLADATGSLPSYDQRQYELVCPVARFAIPVFHVLATFPAAEGLGESARGPPQRAAQIEICI